ncbi:MAG: hypothetical protein HC850_07030 [Rhodomicrobium sp.]|nr:hypothetical protein [Rhodomicrobium sp.]
MLNGPDITRRAISAIPVLAALGIAILAAIAPMIAAQGGEDASVMNARVKAAVYAF